MLGQHVGEAEWDSTPLIARLMRNGFQHWALDSEDGAIGVAFSKLHSGCYFPQRFGQRRDCSEAAMITVMADLPPGGDIHSPRG